MTEKYAFPCGTEHLAKPVTAGMTLLEYAAIKLRLPESGTDWLDSMILESLRNDFAARAMALQPWHNVDDSYSNHAERCYAIADAMLKAGEE